MSATPESTTSAVLDLTRRVALEAVRLARPDLATRVSEAAGRLEGRPVPLQVAVIGPGGVGKSALLNSLLGQSICGVAPGGGTRAVTVVGHGSSPRADAYSSRGVAERVALEDVAAMSLGHRGDVARLVVQTDRALLSSGLVLVDTPGLTGPVGDPRTVAVLRSLTGCSAFVLVVDASREIDREQLEVAALALELCPQGLCVLTSTDRSLEWRRSRDATRSRLVARGLDLPLYAVSSHLRAVGLRLGDPSLDAESGCGALARALIELVDDAVDAARADVVAVARAVVSELAADARSLQRDLVDPTEAARRRADLHRQLREAETAFRHAQHWSDLVADLGRRVRRQVSRDLVDRRRELAVWVEAEVTDLEGRHAWADLEVRLKETVGSAVLRHHEVLARAIDEAGDEVLQALSGEAGPHGLEQRLTDRRTDAPAPPLLRGQAMPRWDRAMHAARGFSLSGSLVGMSYAGLAHLGLAAIFPLTLPVTAAVGLVFAAKALRSVRDTDSRSVRAEARTVGIAWLDHVFSDVARQDEELLDIAFSGLRDHCLDLAPLARQRAAARLEASREGLSRSVEEGRVRSARAGRVLGGLEQFLAALDDDLAVLRGGAELR